MKFTAMTFNMQFGQGWDPGDPDAAPVNLEDTISFLHEHDADIILLQEVERGLPGGVQPSPPPNFTRIKDELIAHHSFFAYPKVNPDELPFGIALAIFSKTPLVGFVSHDLPPAPLRFEFGGTEREPSHRQLIGARTAVAGMPLHLFNTHLQAYFMIGASSVDHPEQRDAVDAVLRGCTGPTLLAGDFNCAPEERLVEQYAAAGFRTAQNEVPTWRRRPYITDHLFFNPPLKAEHVEVIETPCSDHHAVFASFRFGR